MATGVTQSPSPTIFDILRSATLNSSPQPEPTVFDSAAAAPQVVVRPIPTHDLKRKQRGEELVKTAKNEADMDMDSNVSESPECKPHDAKRARIESAAARGIPSPGPAPKQPTGNALAPMQAPDAPTPFTLDGPFDAIDSLSQAVEFTSV